MIPTWLILALDDALPHLTGGERDRFAERLLASLPKEGIAVAIAESAHAVLTTRNIQDGAGDIAREIGRNAAQTVLLTLERVA